MIWNVYVESFNLKEIKVYNIFEHSGFYNYCAEASKEYQNSKKAFATSVKHALTYYFWCKCEWEIILSDWPPSEQFNKKKVSVYDQVMLNWDVFIDYVWNHKEEFERNSM